MGEWELAHNQHPQVARPLFRQARRLSGLTQNVYGIAAYDDAMALFYEGAYTDATSAFRHLEARHTGLRGYDYRTCSLWERHANACASYHAVRANLGIPEPPRLDPLCGVAALAACLQNLGISASRQAVLNASHMTGEGNNLNDIEDAAKKLGASAYPVSAEDKTVIALPKPLVAYVEHDHFVALVRADYSGVSYLCSDCGPWPGGRVNLTWAQWRQMNPGLYLAVTKPGSAWDQRLAANRPGQAAPPVRLAMVDPMGLHSHGILLHVGGRALPKGVTVLNNKKGHWVYCGGRYYSSRCVSYACCLTQGGGPSGGPGGGNGPGGGHRKMGPATSSSPSGPTASDPINLATGEEEYTPTDLTVYNPHGPSISWGRIYDSLQACDPATGEAFGVPEQNDFGNGWSQTYNVGVQDAFGDTTNNKYVYAANGSRTAFVAPAVPNATTSIVLCNVQPGTPFLVYWNYDTTTARTYFQIVNSDRSQWTTAEQKAGTSSYFLIARETDRNGNYIGFNYTTTDTGFPLLSMITNQDGTALLSILRVGDGSGNIAQIADCYGRSVFYHVEKSGPYNAPGGNAYALALDHVSQIVPTGSVVLPDRYVYGYQIVVNYEPASYERIPVNYLHTITVPSPTGTGVSTATINYDTSFNGPLVTSLVDGNGNTTAFISVDSSGNPANMTDYTKVTFTAKGDPSPTYSYIGSYDNNMSGTTVTDGQGRVTSTKVYSDTSDPLRPSSVADGNGNVTKYVWDQFGNMQQMTSPRVTVTSKTWDYSHFAMGELVKVVEGSKTPTTFVYNEPSGLIKSFSMPQPGNVGGPAVVTYSYTYDNLGNILTEVTPGNGAASAITTTFAYTGDGTNVTSPSIGLPLTVTDNLGKTTHLRYDVQGQTVAVIDALGNEMDASYNENGGSVSLGNQVQSVTLPATGQTGGGHGSSTVTYLYPGGPALASTVFDEGGHAIRQVNTTYGKEGETLTVSGSTEPVSYAYDGLYRLKTLTDGAGHATSYFYNGAGYPYQTVYPGAGVPTAPLPAGTADTATINNYDADGNPLSRTDGRNQTTTYSYSDPESALTDITYPSGTIGNVHLSYDAYGRRSTMTDGTGGQTYAYDDADDLTQKIVTWTGLAAKTVSYGFYPNGSRSGMTADGQAFSYGYDKVGRTTGLTNPSGEPTAWSYRDNGWLQSKSLGNAANATVATTAYTQNALGQVTDLLNQSGTGGTLSHFGGMAYDGAGSRTALTASLPGAPTNYSGTTGYTYDSGQTVSPALNRSQLTKETSTRGGYTNNFAYDGGTSTGPGNPTGFKGQVNTFNADNQQTGTGFGYDGSGNTTTYKSQTLIFDPEKRMTVYGSAQTDGYGGDGLRAWKQTGGVRTYFLYDGAQPVGEYASTGTLTATNTFGADGLVSRHTGGITAFYTFDERGSVAQRLGADGSLLSSDLYDGYGARSSTGGADVWGYEAQAGYYTDAETGLILCTHRFYDPANGRWLTRDPLSYRGGVNLYGYTRNNPVDRTDRWGYQSGWGGPGAGDGTSAQPTGGGVMPGQNDPTGSSPGQNPNNPGYLGGAIPSGVPYPGMMPGGSNQESHADCPSTDYPPSGYVLNWVFNTYNSIATGIATGINNGITSVETGIDNLRNGTDFGPGSDFANDWNNTFHPPQYLPG